MEGTFSVYGRAVSILVFPNRYDIDTIFRSLDPKFRIVKKNEKNAFTESQMWNGSIYGYVV